MLTPKVNHPKPDKHNEGVRGQLSTIGTGKKIKSEKPIESERMKERKRERVRECVRERSGRDGERALESISKKRTFRERERERKSCPNVASLTCSPRGPRGGCRRSLRL
jgi:hypothetical protein